MSIVLDTPMDPNENDARATTVREYLVALLARLWDQKEAFNGKRPFGNSGWEGDVYLALLQAGLIQGSVDEDGFIVECDDEGADVLVAEAIRELVGTV
jgi:hypothetical protein